jgi:hypothetical protein
VQAGNVKRDRQMKTNVSVFLMRGCNVLMAHWTDDLGGRFRFISGPVLDSDTCLENAAYRILMDQAKTVAVVGSLKYVSSVRDANGDITVLFKGDYKNSNYDCLPGLGIDRVEWFDVDEVPITVAPEYKIMSLYVPDFNKNTEDVQHGEQFSLDWVR